MIKKEFSLTDVFGALSVVALMISVFSNAFFYYSLDAMWVMSILSPSFYIFEILKVILFLAGSISCVGFLMDAYKWLVSKSFKLRKKKHYKLSVDNSENVQLHRILIRQNRTFQRWQSLFVIVIFTLIVTILQIYRWIDFASMLWMSLIVGMVLGILTHAEVKQDKALKFFILMILVAITTCLSAQLKLNRIAQLPTVYLKQDLSSTQWFVLDATQGQLILLHQNSQNLIKIVKFEEIDRIISKRN